MPVVLEILIIFLGVVIGTVTSSMPKAFNFLMLFNYEGGVNLM